VFGFKMKFVWVSNGKSNKSDIYFCFSMSTVHVNCEDSQLMLLLEIICVNSENYTK